MDKLAASVIGISILIGLTPLLIEKTTVSTLEKDYKSNVTVVEEGEPGENVSLGVRADNNLQFGSIPANAEVIKQIELSTPGKTYVTAETEGNISQVIDYDRKMYFEGTKRMSIKANASEPGYYEGDLGLKIMYSKNNVGKRWLDIKSGSFLDF